MTDPESFYSFRLDGINYHFTFPAPGAPMPPPSEMPAILPQLRALSAGGPPPRKLAMHTSDVYLSQQRNSADERWAIKYNSPGFKSAATGGDGKVVAYNGGTANGETLYHEMGHNLAQATYGGYTPTPSSRFGMAMASDEPPVSDYARAAPAEDFAEAVRTYVANRAAMKANHPLRYAAIEELIGD
jgi:hypothetical protein